MTGDKPRNSAPPDIPSPFKSTLFWPAPPVKEKLKKVKLKLPSAASSEQ